MTNNRNPRVPKPTGSFDILDAMVVVSAAVFLLFVVLWLAGELAGIRVVSEPPGWLKDTAKTGKAALGAVGTTAALHILRARLNRKTNPQYLLWILGVFVVLLLSTWGATKMLANHPSASQIALADVYFSAPFDEGTGICLNYVYPTHAYAPSSNSNSARASCDDSLLNSSKADPIPLSYHVKAEFSTDPSSPFVAKFSQRHTASRGHNLTETDLPAPEQASAPFLICLKRVVMDQVDLGDVFLQCGSDFNCLSDSSRKKAQVGAVSCQDNVGIFNTVGLPAKANRIFNLEPVLAETSYGQATGSSSPYWTVPTLDTLEAMQDRQRAGYTRFDIDLQPSAALRNSDNFQYQVFVNGQPIYFNGFPPEAFRTSFNPSIPLHLSFGLENLSFSGADDGYENLTVVFTFYKGQTQTIQQPVSRKYIALRCANKVEVDSAIGTFHWSGSYIIPSRENKYEVIVNSFQEVADAMKVKAAFDGLKHYYGSSRVVLVIRPPLRTPAWNGLSVGLVQPTGQVKFTFTAQEAAEVYSWAVGERQRTSLFRKDMHKEPVDINAVLTCK